MRIRKGMSKLISLTLHCLSIVTFVLYLQYIFFDTAYSLANQKVSSRLLLWILLAG